MNAFPFRALALALALALAATSVAAQPALRAPPSFAVGQANVGLYTARDSKLGQVLAANRTAFPLLSVRGVFSHAVMTVTLSR